MYLYASIIFAFILLIFIISRKAELSSLLRIDYWMIAGYIFLLLTYLFSGYKYRYHVSTLTVIFILLSLFAFSWGNKVGFNLKKIKIRPLFSLNYRKVGYISIIGCIITLFDYFRLNNIVIGARIENFQVSFIGVFGTVLTSCGIIVWLYYVYYFITIGRNLDWIAYSSLISYMSICILAGGRQAILFIILETFLIFVFAKAIKKRKRLYYKHLEKTNSKSCNHSGLLPIFFIGSLVIVYLMAVSVVRSKIESIKQKAILMESLGDAKIDSNVIEDAENIEPMGSMYLELLFYYSHELPRLSIMIDNYDYPPLLGLCQFHYVGRRLGKMVDPILTSQDKYAEKIVEKQGFYYHTWGTFLNSFIVDFGKLGSIPMLFLFGLLGGMYTRNSFSKPDPILAIRQSIACAGGMFAIQFSPFYDMIWTISLLFLVFVKLQDKSLKLQ